MPLALTNVSLGIGGGASATSSGAPPLPSLSNTYSLSFDGTDDYLDPGTPFESTLQSDFTISTWFKDEASSGTKAFFGVRGYTTPRSDVLSYANDSSIYLWVRYNNTRILGSFTHSRDSDWHHYVFRVNQNGSNVEVRGYLDGVLKLFTYGAETLSDYENTGNLLIGARGYDIYSPDIFFEGKQDEFAIFNSALSDGGVSSGSTAGGDIATIYNGGSPADISSLNPVAWYRMGDTGSDYGTSTITNAATGSNSGGSSIDGSFGGGPSFSTDVP